MKLSKGIRNFWTQIGLILLQSTIAALIAFLISGWKGASFVAAIGVVWVLWFVHETKSKLVRNRTGEWTIKSVNLEDVPSIDFNWLQQQTVGFESIGFTHLMDYQLSEHAQIYARCFAHPQHYCFAEIGLLPKTSSDPPLKSIAIFSLLDEGWRLTTGNRESRSSDSLHLLWRNPKSIAILDPNPNLEEVFQAHLRTRQQIISDLNITVLTDVSWEAYVQFNRDIAVHIKRSLKRNNLLLGMIQATLYELNPKPDWFYGDYPTLAAKRRTRNR